MQPHGLETNSSWGDATILSPMAACRYGVVIHWKKATGSDSHVSPEGVADPRNDPLCTEYYQREDAVLKGRLFLKNSSDAHFDLYRRAEGQREAPAWRPRDAARVVTRP